MIGCTPSAAVARRLFVPTRPLLRAAQVGSVLSAVFVFSVTTTAPRSATAAIATDCTLYAAADGNDANAGVSPNAPKTLDGASASSRPGSVVCLKGGTYNMLRPFYPARSGTANAWIVYRAYGDAEVDIVWVPGSTANDLFYFFSSSPWNGPSYIEVRNLRFDGGHVAAFAIKCNDSHHLRFVANTIQNMGAGGIGAVRCDYLTADGNRIYRSGYHQGWASGITLNSNQWYDRYDGLHNVVVNNIISGTFDASSYRSDGNGIIMDLSNRTYDAGSADTPPALVANNVVYQNGGRCIETYVVTQVWVVNNTCYKNALDVAQASDEIATNKSKGNYFVNNIAQSWMNRRPYGQHNTNERMSYYRNIGYGGPIHLPSAIMADVFSADPRFRRAPALHPTRDGQYWESHPPDQLGDALTLQPDSPAVDAGIDPTTIPGVPAAVIGDLRRYAFADLNGTPRPQGIQFDIGAYELATSERRPSAPSGLRMHKGCGGLEPSR